MLLIGANGTGKTTLLRILAGKHIHEYNSVRILGVSAYFETPKEDLTFLGSEWANNPIVRGDVVVNQLIKSMDGDQYHERRDALVELLDINTEWHMHQVSDGERRRVQILLGLLKPFELLLLDEVTVDLDVLVRADLLNYLQSESEQRGATIIYATHIFDGLNEWATHLAHLSNGKLRVLHEVSEVLELRCLQETNKSSNSPLLQLVEMWLRQEKEEKKYAHRGKGVGCATTCCQS